MAVADFGLLCRRAGEGSSGTLLARRGDVFGLALLVESAARFGTSALTTGATAVCTKISYLLHK
jgi:hypothetical protein